MNTEKLTELIINGIVDTFSRYEQEYNAKPNILMISMKYLSDINPEIPPISNDPYFMTKFCHKAAGDINKRLPEYVALYFEDWFYNRIPRRTFLVARREFT